MADNQPNSPKLFDQVRTTIRLRGMSYQTEKTYKEMDAPEIQIIFHFPYAIYHFSLQEVRQQQPTNLKDWRTVMENDSAEKSSQSKADELEDRLINFAVRIIRLPASLPKTPAGKHMSGQMLRSGTSPAPNYGEARGAESHADFVHKLGIVLKELNETSIWLRIIERGEMLKRELLVEIIEECRELCRIFISSLKTARTGRR